MTEIKTRLVVVLALVGLAGACVRAQDARFHQVNAAPMLTNPAFTGVMEGQLRFTANYQERYSAFLGSEAYRSSAAGVDVRRPAGNGNFFGLGLQVQQDVAGSSDYKRSEALLSGSYQQQIVGSARGRGPVHFLTAGGQIGFGQRGLDLSKLWFSEQYFVNDFTREAYLDRGLATGEPYGGSGGNIYLDVNAGFGWFAQFDDRAGAYLGVSAGHLTAPNISPVTGQNDILDRRYVLHGGGELPLGRGYSSLLPAFRYVQQGPSREALAGASFRYTERAWREIALRLGGYAYLSNQTEDGIGLQAVVVSANLETERIRFGLSYDLTVGNLSQVADGRGGFEISIAYLQPARYRQRVVCPKF